MTDFPASLEVIQAAQKAEKFWLAKTGADVYASVTLAQWAIESDFGKKLSGKNNPFGIKATQAQIDAGDATRCPTKEFVNGAYVAEDLWFADYASLDDAFMEHGRLLATSGYYVRARHATSAEQFAMDLEGIYATAPGYGR
ncbi:MAG: glucosaminidase domain-containing protein, partial [Patescibacteria group bacterium]|nr:glucosaminidase domain-containing protein [Patescibacteria group bacterium]